MNNCRVSGGGSAQEQQTIRIFNQWKNKVSIVFNVSVCFFGELMFYWFLFTFGCLSCPFFLAECHA